MQPEQSRAETNHSEIPYQDRHSIQVRQDCCGEPDVEPFHWAGPGLATNVIYLQEAMENFVFPDNL